MRELIGKYCIVRSANAGVFAGVIESKTGDEVVVSDARRIWYWDGAATLSELSQKGPSRPGNCKFPAAVPSVVVLGVCEVIPCSDAARGAIDAVATWSENNG